MTTLADMRQGERTDLAPIGLKSIPEAAKALGVSVRSVKRARKVIEHLLNDRANDYARQLLIPRLDYLPSTGRTNGHSYRAEPTTADGSTLCYRSSSNHRDQSTP